MLAVLAGVRLDLRPAQQLRLDGRPDLVPRAAARGVDDPEHVGVVFGQLVEPVGVGVEGVDLAKLLRQNGVDTGQKRLFEQLRNEGYLMKTGSSRNMPTQRYVADGLFQIKETVISNPDGSVRMTKTTKVTGKGQQYFLNKYLKKEEAV